MTALWKQAAALLVSLAALQPALAQHTVQDNADPEEVQKLYDEALRSIAEGRKKDASATLMRVIEKESLHAGAYLEVAMVQCSLGRADEAERLFAIVETRFDPPLAILELIAEQRETGCDKWQPLTSASASVARGFDQNVNQGASKPSYIVERDGGTIELPLLPDFLPQHDQYTALNAEYTRELSPNGTVGFAQFLGRRNDSLSQYDSASLYLGVDTPYRFGDWALRTTALIGATVLGGEYYQRQLQLQARLVAPVPLPNHMQFSTVGSATRSEYMALTNFNSNTLELRGQLTYRKDDLYASVSHGWLDDKASNDRPGGNRHGTSTNLLARRNLWRDLSGEVSYTNHTWNSASAYAPGLIEQVRNQSTKVLRGTLAWPVFKNQSIQLEARLVRNKEDISIFQYNNRILQLSWHVLGL
ncbi:MAG: tetratricopeptide repeat protein [Telluria sp.]